MRPGGAEGGVPRARGGGHVSSVACGVWRVERGGAVRGGAGAHREDAVMHRRRLVRLGDLGHRLEHHAHALLGRHHILLALEGHLPGDRQRGVRLGGL